MGASAPNLTSIPGRPIGRWAEPGQAKKLGLAVERGLLLSDPSDFIVGRNAPKVVREARTTPKAWSQSDAQLFLESVELDELAALWTVLLTTGLRRGEALALTWSGVDLGGGSITVSKSLSVIGRELRFQDPKTSQSKRTIAIGEATVSSLKSHRRRQNEARLSTESWGDAMDLVFTNAAGGPLMPGYVTKRLKRLVDDAGLEWIRLHGLRHTMASIALQNGTDIATVSRRLGHSSTHVTARIYLHGSPESDRTAATVLDDVLHA